MVFCEAMKTASISALPSRFIIRSILFWLSRLRITRLKPKFLILTALVLGLIFLAIIAVGIRENQNNMLRMLNREGSALMEAVFIASQNTMRATDLVDDLVILRREFFFISVFCII
jgi:hypothetical protein